MASVNQKESDALRCRPFPDVEGIPLEDLLGQEDDGDRLTSEILERLVEDGRPSAPATKFNSAI